MHNNPQKVAKTFEEILKYNDYHDPKTGRFASKGGGVSIKNVSTDYAYGQTYMRMSAYDGDKEVGYIQYADYEGQPSIHMIEVSEEYKRQGIATRMLQELQSQYDGTEINFGMTTPDGTKLLDKITYDVKDEKVSAAKAELRSKKEELDKTQKELDKLWEDSDGRDLTDWERKKIGEAGDRWDELYNSIRELESSLEGKVETRTFVKLDKSAAQTFDEILKYNDRHDPKTGRFAPKDGGSAFASNTGKFTQEQKDRYIELLNTDVKEAVKYRREMKMTLGDTIEIKREATAAGKLKPKEEPAQPEAPKQPKQKVEEPKEDDYRMRHRPDAIGRGFDISEVGAIPKDVYDHPEWYFDMSDKSAKESMKVVREMRGNPDAEVTIYRAAPKNEFNDGDWVTLSRTYAQGHAERESHGDVKLEVHSMKVKAKEIQFAGDSINEFGYFPKQADEKPVYKSSASDLDEDEAIDLIVSSWDDDEDVNKANPYHDERGRFTTGPGAGANPMIRQGPPPKNTKIAYKVFVVKDGKLYPPMVANPDAMDTPVGVWLDASEGKRATNPDGSVKTNTMGRERVKAGGPGTQGGSGDLAYRPGWHLGDLPVADQFYTKDKKTGEKLQKKNFVWAECEIAADVDYQQEAMSYGYNKNGKFQHSLAGLPKMPTDGYYTYRTNPDPNTRPWYITGSMKVNRILTDAETNKILRDNGIEPRKRAGGELDLEKLGITQTDFTKNDVEKNSFSIYKADEDKRLIFGWASVAVRTDGEQVVDLQKDMIDTEDLEEAVYDYVLEFRDSGEEHIADLRKKGRMVESVIFTKEKMKAMGIPEGTVPEGWWIGFYIDDDDAWEKVKNGTYQMFSIEGQGVREEVKDPEPEVTKSVAKSFKEIIEKFNPWHDRLGRFTSGGGGGAAFSANPHTKAGQMAIARESEKNPLVGSAFNRDYGETGTKDAVDEWSKQSNSLSGFVDENGKLTPEREKLHRQIIDDILRDKMPEAGQATMTMMGGGPASGKSSVIDNGFVKLTDENKTVTIDPDFLKSKLPGYEEMALKTDKAAGFYHEESSALAKRLYSVALSENINVVYDGTGDGSLGSARGKIQQAKAAGYKVKGEYVTIDTAEALRRNQKRYEDGLRKYESGESQTPPRLPNEKLVVSTHMKVTDIAVACAADFDTLNIYDNNGAKGSTKLIATGGGGKGLTATDKAAFNKFLAKGSVNFMTLPDGQVVPE